MIIASNGYRSVFYITSSTSTTRIGLITLNLFNLHFSSINPCDKSLCNIQNIKNILTILQRYHRFASRLK